MSTEEIPKGFAVWIIGPMVAASFGFIGLFWQINSQGVYFGANYLSLREHAEYQSATRRELDSAKAATDAQIASLQKQVDVVTSSIRVQLEEKIKDLQSQIDALRAKGRS